MVEGGEVEGEVEVWKCVEDWRKNWKRLWLVEEGKKENRKRKKEKKL